MLKSVVFKNISVATAYGEALFDKDGISTNLPVEAQKALARVPYLSFVEDKTETPKKEKAETPKKEEPKKSESKSKTAKKSTEKSVTRANDETTEKEKAPAKGRKRSVTRADEDKAE